MCDKPRKDLGKIYMSVIDFRRGKTSYRFELTDATVSSKR